MPEASQLPESARRGSEDAAPGTPAPAPDASPGLHAPGLEHQLSRFLIEESAVGIVATDARGNVTGMNPAALEIVGSPGESASRQFNVLTIPSTVDSGIAETYRRVLEGKRLHRIETTFKSMWGKVSRVSLQVVPILNDEGAVTSTLGIIEDVTARAAAQDALLASEARLRTVVMAALDAFVAMDEDGRITEWTPRAEEMFGWRAEEVIGRAIADTIIPASERDAHLAGLRRLQQGGDPRILDRRIEVEAQHRDGHTFPVELSVAANTSGGMTSFTAFVRDISDRRQAESALRTRVAETRAILRAIPDVMVRVDRDGFLREIHVPEGVDWPPPPEQMLGRNITEAAPSRAAFAPATIRAAFETGELQTREVDMVTPAGPRSLEVRVSVSEGDEAIIMTRDVTDRKRAEAALVRELEFRQRVMESATNAIAALDLTGRFTLVNRRMCELTGYSDEELIGFDVRGLLPADRLAEVVAELAGVLTRGLRVSQYETEIVRKDGTMRLIEFSLAPLMENGEITGVAGTAEDVTERRRLEEQYLQSQKMESIGRLAGGIAHDVSNMMTAIIVNAELDLMSMPSETLLREDLQEIRDTATRAAELSQQLLAFSRRQLIVPQVVGLNKIVTATERLLRRLIGEDIEMSFNADPDAGMVKVDQGQFEQVLVNLVVNARDAMPDGGSILIETQHVELDESHASDRGEMVPGRYAVLSITDTGHGMSHEVQQHLFEPFYTTKEVGRGTGLGLATVYGSVKQANGHISVYSEPGSGSTFRIYLPHVTDEATSSAGGDAPTMATGDETVLLVEDEASVRRPAARLLRQLGYAVLEAGNGAEALRRCEEAQGRIDVVVTDVVMPKMGGSELAQRLAATHPGVRVLFMSGYTEDALVRSKVVDQPISFLQKPFTPALLARRIRDVLDAPLT